MAAQRLRYMAFLLRLWQEESDGRVVWRASLEEAGSHLRHSFSGLRPLTTFLDAKMSGPEEGSSEGGDESAGA